MVDDTEEVGEFLAGGRVHSCVGWPTRLKAPEICLPKPWGWFELNRTRLSLFWLSLFWLGSAGCYGAVCSCYAVVTV